MSPTDCDQSLIRILADKMRNGQTFDQILDEGHAAIINMPREERILTRRLAEEQSKRSPTF